MVQVPAVTMVILLLATVQTPTVDELKVTGKPDDDEAVITGAASPKVTAEVLSVKVIVCAFFTKNVCVTGVAALKAFAFPGCVAVIEQVPIVLIVTVPVGVMVQTAAELLAKATGSLLEAVAIKL
jgi:hypothetical protein